MQPVLKVWMDGHGLRPGTYFQYVLASSHFLGHFGGILESVHALLFSHFKHWMQREKNLTLILIYPAESFPEIRRRLRPMHAYIAAFTHTTGRRENHLC